MDQDDKEADILESLLKATVEALKAIAERKGGDGSRNPKPAPQEVVYPELESCPWGQVNIQISDQDLPVAPQGALRDAMVAIAARGGLMTTEAAQDPEVCRIAARAFAEGWLTLFSNGCIVLTQEGRLRGATTPRDVIDHLRLSDSLYAHKVKHVIAYRTGGEALPQEVQRWIGKDSLKGFDPDLPDPRWDLLIAYWGQGVAAKAWLFDHKTKAMISSGFGTRSKYATGGPALILDYLKSRLDDPSHPMGSTWEETPEGDGPSTLTQ